LCDINTLHIIWESVLDHFAQLVAFTLPVLLGGADD